MKSKNKKFIAAVKYAKRGWPVLAVNTVIDGECSCGNTKCTSVGKHPCRNNEDLPNGVKNATTDLEIIKRWWKRWPDANIGIATGQRSVVVIDVDLPDGPDNLKALEETHGKLPKTVKNITGSGGHQLFFKPAKTPLKCGAGQIAKNIDTRGDGGYVIVPPSMHKSGKRYHWADGLAPDSIEPATLPEWVTELVNAEKKVKNERSEGVPKGKIPEGKRNTTLTSIAGKIWKQGDGEIEDLLAKLLKINQEQCVPPLPNEEVKKIAESVSKYRRKVGKRPSKGELKSQFIDEFLDLYDTFHTPGKVPFAVVVVKDGTEVLPIGSDRLQTFIQGQFYNTYQIPLTMTELREVASVIKAHALFEAEERPIHVRLAGKDGLIFLDLGNGKGEVVKITPEGWEIITDPPVRFLRPNTMAALPVPVKGVGGFKPFKMFFRTQQILTISWIIGALSPHGPFPIMVLHGKRGTAKSTTAKILKMLIDPGKPLLRSLSKNEEDLMISAANSWVLAYDNISEIGTWLSNVFCTLSTGGGLATRKLYTNEEEVVFDVQRPLILNGIEEFVDRPDLRERGLIITLPEIPSDQRQTEKEIMATFNTVRPQLLGCLLDTISMALRELGSVDITNLPRMADFAQWVTAAEASLPWKPGRFLHTYGKYLYESKAKCLELNPIAGWAVRLMKNKEKWKGTATDLLDTLQAELPVKELQQLPQTASHLAKKLKDSLQILADYNLKVRFTRRADQRKIIIKRTGQAGDRPR